MKYLLFFLFLSLILVGCTAEPTTLREELEQLNIPDKYSAAQHALDTGFANTPDTGAYEETHEYEVKDEVITWRDTETNNTPLLTITDIKNIMWNYVDTAEPQNMTKKRCYHHTQWGVEQIEVCFSTYGVHSYSYLHTKGNHQKEEIFWRQLIPID
jgi:patatin-like phospholipase/acyl hydrolase